MAEGNLLALARTLASSPGSTRPLEGLGRAGLTSEQELPGCCVENVLGVPKAQARRPAGVGALQ